VNKSSSSKALFKVSEERRLDIGSDMQLARSCGALPQIKSKGRLSLAHLSTKDDEKSVISENDDSSVEMIQRSISGSNCPTTLSTEAKTNSLCPIAAESTINTWDEQEGSCNSRRAFPSVTSTWETKNDPVRSDSAQLVATPKLSLSLQGRSQAAQHLTPKVPPTGRLLPSFRQHMNMVDSFRFSPRANGEEGIFRQAPLIFNDSYQAIMYNCKPRNSKDYFAPYVKNNPNKIMSTSDIYRDLTHTIPGKKSISIKKLSAKPKKETPKIKTGRRPKREMRNWARLQKRLYQIQNIRGNYYTNFLQITGRVNPWLKVLILIVWTTIVLSLHRDYGAIGGNYITLEINSIAPNYLGMSLGYLLYMQAIVSSRRWWQGRVEWQMLMNKNKGLAIDFNTKLRFVKLTRFGCRLIVAHSTSVWCFLQDKDDKGWYRELSHVLKTETITKIMRFSRRLRPIAILYAFQRMIEICIVEGILPRDAARDINPILVSLSNSFDACNRSRIAQFPWIMAVHLNFVVFMYLVLLPLTLVVKDPEYNRVDVDLYHYKAKFIYAYVVLLSYSFFGLYEMAVVIEDPFSFKKEHYSFGFWGLWEYWTAMQISDIRHIVCFHIRTVCIEEKKSYGKIAIEERNGCGTYGESWSVEKIDPLIKKALEKGILKNSETVKTHLVCNSPGLSFFELFSKEPLDESSVISLASTSDDDKHEVGTAKVLNKVELIYECPEEKKYTSNPSLTLAIAPAPKII